MNCWRGSSKIIEEWDYEDRQEKQHRALDVHGVRWLPCAALKISPMVALFIECKRSEFPYCFFPSARPEIPEDFPTVVGLPFKTFTVYHAENITQEATPARFMGLRESDFVTAGPPICNTVAQLEKSKRLSGEQPFRRAVMPLINAVHHWAEMQLVADPQRRASFWPALSLPVCVLDAPMIVARGTPETPRLELCPWVRVVRHQSVRTTFDGIVYEYQVVDFVHRGYTRTYWDEQVMPLAQAWADRISSAEQLFLGGRATVPNIDSWRWEDLRPKP